MAFNKAPTTLLPSYSSDGTNMTIPIAAIEGLTAAEAHTTTGDWRAIAFRFMAHVDKYYNALATADKPTLVSAQRQQGYNATARTNSVRLTLSATTEVVEEAVSDEP